MPKFEIEIPHQLDSAELRTRLSKATSKLESDYGAACKWEGDDRLVVSRKGLQASVQLEASRVFVALELGFVLTPLAGTIKTGISKRITELLA